MLTKSIIKVVKQGFILLFTSILIAAGIFLYLLKKPHRIIHNEKTDYSLSVEDIVSEFLIDSHTANNKYLAHNGESKILEITGEVKKIYDDYNGNKVILLQSDTDKAGVSCYFTKETSLEVLGIDTGQTLTIKGVIRSGAGYDTDLAMYENVILTKCKLIIIKNSHYNNIKTPEDDYRFGYMSSG